MEPPFRASSRSVILKIRTRAYIIISIITTIFLIHNREAPQVFSESSPNTANDTSEMGYWTNKKLCRCYGSSGTMEALYSLLVLHFLYHRPTNKNLAPPLLRRPKSKDPILRYGPVGGRRNLVHTYYEYVRLCMSRPRYLCRPMLSYVLYCSLYVVALLGPLIQQGARG